MYNDDGPIKLTSTYITNNAKTQNDIKEGHIKYLVWLNMFVSTQPSHHRVVTINQ